MTKIRDINEKLLPRFPKCETGKNGCNKAIKVRLLPEKEMRDLGFTECKERYWYLCLTAGDDITFNLTINKRDASDFSLDALDEEWGQPYDYQHILENTRLSALRKPFACITMSNVLCQNFRMKRFFRGIYAVNTSKKRKEAKS